MNKNELLEQINRAKLTHASRLDLGNESLTEIPTEFSELNSLIWLNLGDNKLTQFPKELIKLKNLQVLLLYDNQISSLPIEIMDMKNLVGLNLDGNPLPIPKEIVSYYSKPEKIINYYFKSIKGKPINQCKIVVVGEANVGKTCVVNRLIFNKFENTKSTQGIKIYYWENEIKVNDEQIQLNVWDFGGQEIMHSTHQFFFTKRTIYILVVNARENFDSNRIEEWLKRIETLGGDSPVIIVGNKVDENERNSNQQNLGYFDINRAELQSKYPNIKGFYGISCDVKKKQYDCLFNDFKDGLALEISELKEIQKLFPLNWFSVKKQLEKMTEENIPFISYNDYINRCINASIDEELDQKTLVEFLHDLGIVLSFQDDKELRETMVFNPEWVTRGVYAIIDNPLIKDNKGILEQAMLKDILDEREYPLDKHEFIIRLMKKFELCVDIEKDRTFLIPDLLPLEETYTGDWDSTLNFQYHYENYLKSIFTRFIVKIYPYILKKTYWRNGVVLQYEGVKALIKAESSENKILIFIKGTNTNKRREFLAIIREKLKEINSSFANLPYKEKIAHPKYTNILRDYNRLLLMEDDGIEEEYVEELRMCISVKEWLDGVESPEVRQNRRIYDFALGMQSIKKKETEIEKILRELTQEKKKISEVELLAKRIGRNKSIAILGGFSVLITSVLLIAIYLGITIIGIGFSFILFLVPLIISLIKGKEWSFTKHIEQIISEEKKMLLENLSINVDDYESKQKILANLQVELKKLETLVELKTDEKLREDIRKSLEEDSISQQNDEDFESLKESNPASEHLREARIALDDGYNPMNENWGNMGLASEHIKAIPRNAPEYKEAQNLVKEINERKKERKEHQDAVLREVKRLAEGK